MPIAVLLLIIIPVLSGWASYAVSRAVHRKLVNAGNAHAKILRAVTMVGSFIIILASLFMLIMFNVRFER